MINNATLINLDFADVQTVMKDKGIAHIGIGQAKGDDKALEAVKIAVASPLLETTIQGASDVIINVSGDISLMDANEAVTYVQDLTGDDTNIIFGASYDDTKTDEASITIIATGIEAPKQSAAQPSIAMPKYKQPSVAQPTANKVQESVRNTVDIGSATASINRNIGIQKPVLESRVEENSIKIPEFLQRNKK